MRNENEGALKIHVDCKAFQAMLAADMLKSSQCVMGGGFTIRKITEIERESIVNFEHMHAKITNELEDADNNEGKTLVLKCDMTSKDERTKCEEL